MFVPILKFLFMNKRDNLLQRLSQTDASGRAHLLIHLLKTEGLHHFEEEVTQYAHAIQSAYWAKNNGADAEMVSAALLHDVGHLLVDDVMEEGTYNEQDHHHEDIAAEILSPFLGKKAVDAIKLHVLAKRYLVSKDLSYYDLLSVASRDSFHLQGGMMSEEEIADFESMHYYQEALDLRRWDDLAKSLDLIVPEADAYLSELTSALEV